jgi:hypothetical protein
MSPPFLREPIDPARVRVIDGSFAFVPHAFLRRGFFAALTQDERDLYFFLLLAGDRRGVSFYHYDSICSALECSLDAYIAARNGLIDKDLVAFDGSRFQILSLPDKPRLRSIKSLRSSDDLEQHDPATIRRLLDGEQR